MFQDLEIDRLQALRSRGEITLIDVRSPAEYADSTIPGSLNLPLFDDEERAEVGTLYVQVGVQAAKDRGLEIVSAKLPAFVRAFGELPGKKAVFCWRGGMRSRTTATLLSLMDIHVSRLAGGYRAYRKWVVETLEGYEMRPRAIVLHGNTGTGKTAVLRKLRQQGEPVLDLEGAAAHRGSIFGQIGLAGHNQKTFDALLLDELLRYADAPYVWMEAESKRIGKAVMPDFLVRAKETGTHVWLDMPLDVRVRHILEDYRPWEHGEEIQAAFQRIKSRIHTPIAHEIEGCLKTERYEPAVRMLLEHYYDPRYAFSSEGYGTEPGVVVKAVSVDDAAAQLQRISSAKRA